MSERRVVIAVFTMKGCGACEMMYPTVQKLASKYANCVTTYVIDSESARGRQRELADRHKITATPTTILFRKNGTIAGRKEGVLDENELTTWYETALKWSTCEL